MTNLGPHLLGRQHKSDERDYDLARYVERAEAPQEIVVWDDPYVLDQGQTGHCVGFGWAGWMGSRPVEYSVSNIIGHATYYACKVVDGDPEGEDGSYVRSGAIVMQGNGRLDAYAFTQNVEVVKAFLFQHGPIVVGSDWTDDMFYPDESGVVRPTGAVAGGHCYLVIGYDVEFDMFICRNSWGNDWAHGGTFYIHVSDMATLLNGIDYPGEACAAVENLRGITREFRGDVREGPAKGA